MNTKPAIITPFIDILCIGGLSILTLLFFLVADLDVFQRNVLEDYILLTILFNGTHFMASYRLLYGSPEMVKKYLGASVIIPIVLLSYGAFALYAAAALDIDVFVQLLLVIVGVYLAFHYTGQVWGMMASFSFMEGVRFSSNERAIFKTVLMILTLWQVAWTLQRGAEIYAWVPGISVQIYQYAHLVLLMTVPVSVYTFYRYKERIAKPVPIRVWLPLASIYVWYIMMYQYPYAIFWVQISHAIQYLIFPFRVEANRQQKQNDKEVVKNLAFYVIGLIVIAWFVFFGIEKLLTWGEPGFKVYATVWVALINIHHFYTDGCIWKISNPEVRKDLFSHLHSNSDS